VRQEVISILKFLHMPSTKPALLPTFRANFHKFHTLCSHDILVEDFVTLNTPHIYGTVMDLYINFVYLLYLTALVRQFRFSDHTPKLYPTMTMQRTRAPMSFFCLCQRHDDRLQFYCYVTLIYVRCAWLPLYSNVDVGGLYQKRVLTTGNRKRNLFLVEHAIDINL
jgi:hypothetical protein